MGRWGIQPFITYGPPSELNLKTQTLSSTSETHVNPCGRYQSYGPALGGTGIREGLRFAGDLKGITILTTYPFVR